MRPANLESGICGLIRFVSRNRRRPSLFHCCICAFLSTPFCLFQPCLLTDTSRGGTGILQDSPADWSFEAARMGQYYSNSLLTLSAVSASDGSGGLFWDRNPLLLNPYPIEIRFPSSGGNSEPATTLYGFIHPHHGRDPSDDTHQYEQHRPPLWQRAWVLQERMLSPRLLRFSKLQMSWLCRCAQASESVPEGRDNTTDGSKESKELQTALLGLRKYSSAKSASTDVSVDCQGLASPADLVTLYDAWYDLVCGYTKCGLTVKSDMFPAISGIASAVARATGDEYAAGLWAGDMHRGLLWTAVDSTKTKADLRHYRAPSWSWASVPGTCSFLVRSIILEDVETHHFEICGIELAKDQANPLGAVESGLLRTKGLLKRAQVAPSAREVDGDVFAKISGPHSSESLFDLALGKGIGYFHPDNVDRENLVEIICTPVVSTGSITSIPGESNRHWHGLGLLEVSPGIYMRVGSIWIKESGWFDDCEKVDFSII
jgi:hypothetical protein